MYIAILLLTSSFAYCSSSSTADTSAGQKHDRTEYVDLTADDAKRLRSDEAAIAQPVVLFDGNKIIKAFEDHLIRYSGTVWAAQYAYTSAHITNWWANRKYIQEFRKANAAHDINAMMHADFYKTSPKEDFLIVDVHSLKYPNCKPQLTKLTESGIKVYIRHKPRSNARLESMHHKWMIFFDEHNNPKAIITGSFNLTEQALFNHEDVRIDYNPEIIKEYIKQIKQVLIYCSPYDSTSESGYKIIDNQPTIEKINELITLGEIYLPEMNAQTVHDAIDDLIVHDVTKRYSSSSPTS